MKAPTKTPKALTPEVIEALIGLCLAAKTERSRVKQ